MTIKLDRLDHLVLTVRDIEATCRFYERVLGMRRESFGEGRTALHFGRQKINLHPYPSPVEIVAKDPRPGSADLCFVTETPIAQVAAHLEACGVAIESGPGRTHRRRRDAAVRLLPRPRREFDRGVELRDGIADGGFMVRRRVYFLMLACAGNGREP